jgi:hypothetical protein
MGNHRFILFRNNPNTPRITAGHPAPAVVRAAIRHAVVPVGRQWLRFRLFPHIDDAGNRKPSKKRSSGRIDGLVALVMAIDAAPTTAGTEPVIDVAGSNRSTGPITSSRERAALRLLGNRTVRRSCGFATQMAQA